MHSGVTKSGANGQCHMVPWIWWLSWSGKQRDKRAPAYCVHWTKWSNSSVNLTLSLLSTVVGSSTFHICHHSHALFIITPCLPRPFHHYSHSSSSHPLSAWLSLLYSNLVHSQPSTIYLLFVFFSALYIPSLSSTKSRVLFSSTLPNLSISLVSLPILAPVVRCNYSSVISSHVENKIAFFFVPKVRLYRVEIYGESPWLLTSACPDISMGCRGWQLDAHCFLP